MKGLYILCVVVTLFNLVSSCEKDTHYVKDGKCCKMCGPGKRMRKIEECDDPICQDCSEGEYQSGYTSDTKCKLQPSCDTNVNFLPQATPTPKDMLSICVCKPGYFCTEADDCSTCRKHKVCVAGQKILKAGTSVSDTVCVDCNNGTFSDSDSSTDCKELTTCTSGYVEKKPGTSKSDRICEEGTPVNRGAILGGVLGVLALIVAAGVIMYIIKKRKIEWKLIPKHVHNQRVILQNEDPLNNTGHEEGHHQPEEDVDVSIPESPTANVTDKGNVVVQENGKNSILSSSETRPFDESTSM